MAKHKTVPATHEEKISQSSRVLTGIERTAAERRNKEAKKHKKSFLQIHKENKRNKRGRK